MAATAAITGAWSLMTSSTVGTNTALHGRLHDGAFLCSANAGGIANQTWRAGVLPTTKSLTSSLVTDFYVRANSTPNMTVIVGAGTAVVSRASQGPYVAYAQVDSANLTVTAANATNPRIDRVYLQVTDFQLDGSSFAIVGISTGVAKAVPLLSDAALPANSITLGSITVGATVTTLAQGVIADLRTSTSLSGSERFLLPGDLITDPGFTPGEQRVRTVGGVIQPPEVWGYDGVWHGTAIKTFVVLPNHANIGTGNSIFTYVVADPGYPYKLRIDWQCLINVVGLTSGSWVQELDTTITNLAGAKIGSLGPHGRVEGVVVNNNPMAKMNCADIDGTSRTGATTISFNITSATAGNVGVLASNGTTTGYTRAVVEVIPV